MNTSNNTQEYSYNNTLEKIIVNNFVDNATIRLNFSWDNSVESISLYLHNYEIKTIIDNNANFQLDERLKFGELSTLRKYKIKEKLDLNPSSHDLSYYYICQSYPFLKAAFKNIYHNFAIKNLLKIYHSINNPSIHMDYNIEFITNDTIIEELNNIDYFSCDSPHSLSEIVRTEHDKYNTRLQELAEFINIDTFILKTIKKRHIYYTDVEYYIMGASNVKNLQSLLETAYGFSAEELLFSLISMLDWDKYTKSLAANDNSSNNTILEEDDIAIPEIGLIDYIHKYNIEHKDNDTHIKYRPTLGLDIDIQSYVEDIIDNYAYSIKQEEKILKLVDKNTKLERSLITLENEIALISAKYLNSLEKYEAVKHESELKAIINDDNDDSEHISENNHSNVVLNTLKLENNNLFFKLEELESERYSINTKRTKIITELVGRIPLDLKNVATVNLQDYLEEKLNGINNVRNIAYYRRNYSTNYYDSSYLLNVLEGESHDG